MSMYDDVVKRRRERDKETERKSVSSMYDIALNKRKAGIDTIEQDYSNLASNISKAYSGWQTPETMSNLTSSVDDMKGRLTAYGRWARDTGNENADSITKLAARFEGVPSTISDLSKAYSGYKDKTAFDSAVRIEREKESAKKYHTEADYDKRIADLTKERSKLKGMDTVPLYNTIEALKKMKNDFAKNPNSKYEALRDAEDFAEKSQFVEGRGGNVDVNKQRTYRAINGQISRDASSTIREGATEKQIADFNRVQEALKRNNENNYLTDDEKSMYNYLYNNGRMDDAESYLNNLNLSSRVLEAQKDYATEQYRNMNGLQRTLASLVMIPANIGLSAYNGVVDLANMATGGNLTGNDVYEGFKTIGQTAEQAASIPRDVQSQIMGEKFGKAGQLGYEAVYSALNSLAGVSALGHGFEVVMGLGAAHDTYNELSQTDTPMAQTIIKSLSAGVLEALFEHLPTETLLQMSKNTTSLRQLVANLLKVGAEEGLEEAGTEASNNIVDFIVGQISEAMGGEDTSKLKGAFDEYVARGYSTPEAKEMVFKDVLQNVTTAGVTGALSGMLMGGSSAIDLGINNSVGKQVIHPEALAEVAKTYGSDFADYVAKLQSNPTNAEKGAIYRQISDKVDASTLNLIGKWTEGKEDTDLENKVVGARANVEKSVTKTEADEQRESDKRSDAEIVQSMGSEYAEDVQKVFTDNYEGQNPYEYKALFDLAYENGARATGLSEVLTSQNISADAIKNIYKAGVSSRSVVESKLNEITKDFSKLHIKKGMGRFDDSAVDTGKFTKAQKETVALLHAFSDKMGVNITLYQSTAEEQKNGKPNGFYDPKTNTIHVDVNAGLGGTKIQEAIIIPTISHEITHWSKTKALDLYNKLSESVFDALYESDGISADARIEAEKERLLKNEGIEADDDYARDEVVARACEDMLKNSKTVDKYLKKMNAKELSTFKEKVAEIFDSIIEFFHELASAFSSEKAEAIAIRQMEDEAKKLQKQWDAMLDKAIQTNKGQMTDVQLMDSIKTEVNTTALEEAGAVVYDDGSVLMSQRTYEEDGKGLLEDYLKDLVDAKEIDEADAKDIVDNLDRIFQYARSLENSGEFVSYSNWAKAEAINLSDGGVLSVRVPNGEYAYNFDFSTICKKRKALDTVLNLMIKNPDFNVNTLTKTGIAKLNNLIKANGFEIACALCFVDSKRYNIRDWANSLCYGSEDKETKTHKMGYNDMIDILEKASGRKATEFKFTSDDNKNIASNEHDVIKAFAAKVKDNTAITVEKGSLADTEGYDFSDTIVYKMVADFDKEYNEASEWLASHPNASDDEKEEHKKPTENEQVRIARTLLDNPSLRQRLNPKDLIEGEGLDNIMIASEPLYRLVHMHGGTSKPKEAHHSVAYDNVVINDKNLTADKVKYVGGARLQSFSDFMANMFFDYCQLFTDLQAKDIPLQAYTKEEAFVRIFGMTGVKANMSIVFKGAELTDEEAKYFDSLSDAKKKTDAKYLEKKKYAGLKVKDEYKGQNIADLINNKVFDAFDYIIEDESFASDVNAAEGHKGEKGFETAKKLQKMPQFMHDIGIIGVGVSDLHILKMLDDDDIPMIIPYHKSGLNYELAKLRRIDFYNDYTGQQNTLTFKSQEVKKAFEKTHPVRNAKYYSDLLANQSQYLKKYDGKDYNFYDALYGNDEKGIAATNDPKLACDEYIKWCEDNGLVPKFYQFKDHPNYYKMIIDYKVYDYNGVEPSKVASRQYLPQHGVKLQMPEDYKEWVEKGLRLQNETDTALDEKAPRIAEIAVQVINTRGVDGNIKLWDENGNEIHGQQGKVQYSSRAISDDDIDSWLDALDITDILDAIEESLIEKPKPRAERRKDNVLKRLRNLGLSFNGDKEITWTDERIDKYLSGGWYGSTNKDYAQAYITYMTPQQFLNLTVGTNDATMDMLESESADYGEIDFKKLGDSSPIFLEISENGSNATVWGHEGRHRMILLGRAGFKRVPVLLFNSRNKYDKEHHDFLKLKPQKFNIDDFISSARNVMVEDVVPFSLGNRDEIIEKFGSGNTNADVMYSFRDIDYDVADADEAVDRIISENKLLGEDLQRLNTVADNSIMRVNDSYAKTVTEKVLGKYGSTADVNEVSKLVSHYYNVLLKGNVDVVDLFNLGGEIGDKILNSTNKFSDLDGEVGDYLKSDMKRAIIMDLYEPMWKGIKFPNTDAKKRIDKMQEKMADLKKAHSESIAKVRDYYKDKAKESKNEIKKHYNELLAKYEQRVKDRYDKKLENAKESMARKVSRMQEGQARKIALAKVTKRIRDLEEMLQKNNKQKRVNEVLKPFVKDILDMIDYDTNYINEGKQISKSLAKAFENLRNFVVDDFESPAEQTESFFNKFDDAFKEDIMAYANDLAEMEKAMKGKSLNIRTLDAEHLEELANMLTYIEKVVKNTNRLFGSMRRQYVEDMAHDMDADISRFNRSKIKQKVNGVANFVDYSLALPYYTFKRLGQTGMELFERLMDGWDKFAFTVSDIINDTQTFYGNNDVTDNDIEKWKKDTHEIDAVDMSGNTVHFKATSAQLMSLLDLSRRAEAHKHLEGKGFRIAETDANGQQRDNIRMQADDITEMCLHNLTDKQIKVAEFMQEMMSTLGSQLGNEVTLERWGIKKFTEKNYFPMQTVLNVTDDKAMASQNSIFRLLNASFTNDLNKKANNALLVSNIFDIYSSHMSDMAKYNALGLPTLDLFRVWNFKEDGETVVKKDIEFAFGNAMNGYIETFLKDINGASSGGFEHTDSFAKKMVRNYKIAAVGANLRVAILQPTAYVRASYVIPSKYLTASLRDAVHIKEFIDDAEKNCGMARWKGLGFYDTNVSRGIADKISGGGTKVERIIDKSSIAAEFGDRMTWGFIYHACELEARDKGLKDEAAMDFIRHRFREIIYQTQVVDSTMTRTQSMRSKSTLVQMVTAFMTEPMQSFNMLCDGYYDYERDKQLYGTSMAFKRNGKKITKAFGTYLITLMCASLVGAVPDFLRDDEKEYTIEDYLKMVGSNALQDAFGMIPYVKDVISVAEGYSLTRMDEQFIQTSINAYKQLTNGEFNYKDVYMTAKAVSQTTGIPISNVIRGIKTVIDTSKDAFEMWNGSIGETYPSMKVK